MRGPFRSFCRILSRHSISGSVTGLRKDRAVDDRDETLLTTMMCTGHVRQAEWRGWIGSGRPKEGKTDQNQRWIKETIDDRVSYRGPVDIRPRGLAGGWFRVGVPQRVEALRRKTTRGKGAAKPEEKSKILYAPVETEESLDGNRSVVSVAAVDRSRKPTWSTSLDGVERSLSVRRQGDALFQYPVAMSRRRRSTATTTTTTRVRYIEEKALSSSAFSSP